MPCQAISPFQLFLSFTPCPRAISCAANDTVMPKSSPPPVERSFTLIELLVVVATISILAALAVPVFNSTVESPKATKDMSNLRQLCLALQTYLNDKNQIH